MADKTALEERVTALEQTVLELQNQLAHKPKSEHEDWFEKLAGSISNEAIFLEALEYGRAYRQSDRPKDDSDEIS